jgi:hypothetical protein
MLPRFPMLMATFGLAVNMLLWSVPVLVVTSAVPHAVLPESAPTLASVLASLERAAAPDPSLPDALVQLIGAEAEALQVAGAALRQPTSADLAATAGAAGARVLLAMTTYARSAKGVVDGLGLN